MTGAATTNPSNHDAHGANPRKNTMQERTTPPSTTQKQSHQVYRTMTPMGQQEEHHEEDHLQSSQFIKS